MRIDAALPVPDLPTEAETETFWRAAASGKLMITRCTLCAELVWIPRSFCPLHMTAGTEWVEVSGLGTVYSYTVVHRGEGPYAGIQPFVLAYVELAEGPRIMTNLVGVTSGELAIGTTVQVVFDVVSEHKAIPRFRPGGA
ncbi:Zn-ribbon domain-containing OB-fold protein [Mycolicibacterium sp. P9-22]|uniref:Zn-ribbon domain-containing OB-fold protein n=1 Tax=Mycolicibacterium sp. P9-22 TaxID=2024613 RepID=UPI0011ED2E0E|nr:Zn-ribbon domain-containing OB-fold protein [Mycolicibacterium sp. P9-22]KAA0120616.1 Zn-ribbon domain-containing OB-fold protein [Mycolicibacterium sp. P9-22]